MGKKKHQAKQQQQESEVEEVKLSESVVQGYICPIADPLASQSFASKVFKRIKKMNKQKLIKKGIKQVVKSIRKNSKGLCLIAADISPVDCISHLPVLCQNNDIPYAFVKNRKLIGEACGTKRPTSCILLVKPSKQSAHLQRYQKFQDKVRKSNPYF